MFVLQVFGSWNAGWAVCYMLAQIYSYINKVPSLMENDLYLYSSIAFSTLCGFIGLKYFMSNVTDGTAVITDLNLKTNADGSPDEESMPIPLKKLHQIWAEDNLPVLEHSLLTVLPTPVPFPVSLCWAVVLFSLFSSFIILSDHVHREGAVSERNSQHDCVISLPL
jgi:hypothetical protein